MFDIEFATKFRRTHSIAKKNVCAYGIINRNSSLTWPEINFNDIKNLTLFPLPKQQSSLLFIDPTRSASMESKSKLNANAILRICLKNTPPLTAVLILHISLHFKESGSTSASVQRRGLSHNYRFGLFFAGQEVAYEEGQKYKEGRYIIEKAKMEKACVFFLI